MSGTNNGKYILSTTNKDGISVVLETDTYHNHILVNHPEMRNNVEAIKDSIENPIYMFRSSKNEKNVIYITQSTLSTYPKLFITTVVNHANPNQGYVRTSFFKKVVDTTKEGKIIYEKD